MLPYILASNAGELLQDDGGLSQEISSTIRTQPESFANEIIHWEESWRFFIWSALELVPLGNQEPLNLMMWSRGKNWKWSSLVDK
jgi:hypothetical protein